MCCVNKIIINTQSLGCIHDSTNKNKWYRCVRARSCCKNKTQKLKWNNESAFFPIDSSAECARVFVWVLYNTASLCSLFWLTNEFINYSNAKRSQFSLPRSPPLPFHSSRIGLFGYAVVIVVVRIHTHTHTVAYGTHGIRTIWMADFVLFQLFSHMFRSGFVLCLFEFLFRR